MAKTETVVQVVDMDDGRKVEFTGKKRLIKTVNTDAGVSVRLDFVNGETRLFTLPEALFAKAAGHGISQKLGDEIASVEDLEDAIEAIDQLMGRLANGEWNVAATGGSGMAGASILARALVEVTGQPISVVREYLSGLDVATKRALAASDDVRPVVQKLEAEKAARDAAKGKSKPTVDTASILAGLAAGIKPQSALPTA